MNYPGGLFVNKPNSILIQQYLVRVDVSDVRRRARRRAHDLLDRNGQVDGREIGGGRGGRRRSGRFFRLRRERLHKGVHVAVRCTRRRGDNERRHGYGDRRRSHRQRRLGRSSAGLLFTAEYHTKSHGERVRKRGERTREPRGRTAAAGPAGTWDAGSPGGGHRRGSSASAVRSRPAAPRMSVPASGGQRSVACEGWRWRQAGMTHAQAHLFAFNILPFDGRVDGDDHRRRDGPARPLSNAAEPRKRGIFFFPLYIVLCMRFST